MTKDKIRKLALRVFKIWFADAKSTFDRVVNLFSALFWTWLEFTFLKVILTYTFGIAGYVLGGTYEYSYDMMITNKGLINGLILIYILITFIVRVPLYIKKEIKGGEK